MRHLRTPAHNRAGFAGRITAIAAGVAALAAICGNANAFDLETGNPDLTVRWDNTARLNYGVRVEERDSKIGNSALADEGTYSFDKGDAVAQRLTCCPNWT